MSVLTERLASPSAAVKVQLNGIPTPQQLEKARLEAARALRLLEKEAGDSQEHAVLLAYYQGLDDRYGRLVESDQGLSPDKPITISEGPIANETRNGRTIPLTLEEGSPVKILKAADATISKAFELITKNSENLDAVQLADLVEMYDQLEQYEDSMRTSRGPGPVSITEAKLCLADAQQLLERARLMVAIVQSRET